VRPARGRRTLQRLRLVLGWLLAPVLAYWLIGLLLFRFVTPVVTPLMLIRSVERGAPVRHHSVALSAVAPSLRSAVVAAEDSNFCLHAGIDLRAVRDALHDYRATGRVRGASTITMQVARNLFLWPGGGALRKGVEIPLALAVDALWPKRRILEVYLGIAEMGPGIFGAEAAARAHFGVAAAALTAEQSARLAAVLPNPIHWSAATPGAYVRARARAISTQSARLSAAQSACLGPR